jgi:2-desacetyl-2-hydroxyethyl bacteriochlorophyllide A dehydrogenase
MSNCVAVVCRRPGDIECESLDLAPVGPGQVLVRTLMSGVSTGTDKWVMSDRFGWADTPFPAVPGYQRVGVVEGVGSDVVGLRAGQRVVATSGLGFVGAGSAWGGHASRSISEAAHVYDADGIPPERSAFVVVAQVGYNAASRLLSEVGSHVLVVGDGVIGASAAFA